MIRETESNLVTGQVDPTNTRKLFQERIGTALERRPVIASASFEDAKDAVHSEAGAVLLMKCNINQLLSQEFRTLMREKPILIHTDFLRGVDLQHESLEFLKRHVDPAGIVSTKGKVVRAARKVGIPAILRVFLIDLTSFFRTIDGVNESDPDAIEVMPGIAPQVVDRFREYVALPIILGGMLTTTEEINSAFMHGANAVSVGDRRLWDYCP
jgi:glycerol uptake operon antiterminator